MIDVPAVYFDPRGMQSRRVRLRWHAFDGVFEIEGDGVSRRLPRREVTVEVRIGRGPRQIRFRDGGHCEIPEGAGYDAIVDTWMTDRSGGIMNRAELGWLYAMVALLLVIALGWAAIRFAVPWGAHRIAFMLPPDQLRELGEQTLATLDRTEFTSTQLGPERQNALQAEFKRFLASAGDDASYRIEFRAAPKMGANALALPSGVIVITDELVALARDDREILGVLAHECGHIRHRHALRGILQNSAVFVMIAVVTGDLSVTATFGGALPTYLLQARFSREFEREADAHAIATLRAAHVEPAHLARMLERMGQSHGEHADALQAYLGSHPPTRDRIRAIENAPPPASAVERGP